MPLLGADGGLGAGLVARLAHAVGRRDGDLRTDGEAVGVVHVGPVRRLVVLVLGGALGGKALLGGLGDMERGVQGAEGGGGGAGGVGGIRGIGDVVGGSLEGREGLADASGNILVLVQELEGPHRGCGAPLCAARLGRRVCAAFPLLCRRGHGSCHVLHFCDSVGHNDKMLLKY